MPRPRPLPPARPRYPGRPVQVLLAAGQPPRLLLACLAGDQLDVAVLAEDPEMIGAAGHALAQHLGAAGRGRLAADQVDQLPAQRMRQGAQRPRIGGGGWPAALSFVTIHPGWQAAAGAGNYATDLGLRVLTGRGAPSSSRSSSTAGRPTLSIFRRTRPSSFAIKAPPTPVKPVCS